MVQRGAAAAFAVSAGVVGSSTAACLELSYSTAVMAIGVFTGTGQATYFIFEKDWRGKPGGWPAGDRNHTGISDVYDLSRPR